MNRNTFGTLISALMTNVTNHSTDHLGKPTVFLGVSRYVHWHKIGRKMIHPRKLNHVKYTDSSWICDYLISTSIHWFSILWRYRIETHINIRCYVWSLLPWVVFYRKTERFVVTCSETGDSCYFLWIRISVIALFPY